MKQQAKCKQMYTNLELKAALELGYKVTRVYRIWHWERTQRGLFKAYVDMFLRLKQQATGQGSELTPEEHVRFIQDYKRDTGIQLVASEIKANPGLYAVAKMYLNSLWGKFVQRLKEDFTECEILHDTEQGNQRFYSLRKENRIRAFRILTPQTAMVKSRQVVTGMNDKRYIQNGNIAVGIFTTSQARLKLYKELLQPLGPRILYCDTDSAVFHTYKGETPQELVQLGVKLGDLTNELGRDKYSFSPEVSIQEFVAAAPKAYGYRLQDDTTQAKIKGFKSNTLQKP